MLELLAGLARRRARSRLDRDHNGTIDHPGAAIMDKAWPKIADAVMGPVLGPQLGDLASLMSRDNQANNQGSSYNSGWYGYVDKDLRTLAGRPVAGAFKTRFCGARRPGRVPRLAVGGARRRRATSSRTSSRTRTRTTGASDATAERIFFSPGFLGITMRWTNRPTFQQAISYSSHR